MDEVGSGIGLRESRQARNRSLVYLYSDFCGNFDVGIPNSDQFLGPHQEKCGVSRAGMHFCTSTHPEIVRLDTIVNE